MIEKVPNDDIFLHVHSIRQNIEEFCLKFKSHPSADQFSILNDLIEVIPLLATFGLQMDYKNVKANGVRSIIRSCDRLCQTSLTITDDEVDDFICLLKHLNKGVTLLLEGSQDIIDDIYDLEFNRKAVTEACSFGEEVLKRSLSHRYFCLNSPAFRPVLIPIFMISSFIYSLNYWDAITSLFSLNASADNYARSVHKISAEQMSQFVRITDRTISRVVTRIMRIFVDGGASYETQSISISVPSEYEIAMGVTNVELGKRSTPTTNKVSFTRIRRGRSDKYQDKVLMFQHGGAFFGPSAESLEDMYVKDFAARCPGLTVINVDYPCAPEHRFPEALQYLMDLYLWLISGDESVQKLLGFEPKEIVLSGDSCGGNLATCLLLILNDLRLQGLANISLMPRSLALFFPKLSIRLELQPSTCLAVMDPLINLFVLLRVGQAYAPATCRDSEGVECVTRDVPHDYYLRKEYNLLSTPYTSPHLYEHLETLSDVHLNIMALHFDPLLDESIRLCKRWQGPVDLQVVDETCHGAFIFRVLYPSVGVEILDVAVSLIQKSFSDIS